MLSQCTFKPIAEDEKIKVEDFWPELLDETNAKRKMFEKWAGSDFEFTEKLFELMIQTYTEEFLHFVSAHNRPDNSVYCTAIRSHDPNGDLNRLTAFLR